MILAEAAREAARTEAKAALARRREEKRAAMRAWLDGAMARQVAANRRWRATPMGRMLTKESNRRYYRRRKLRDAAAGSHATVSNGRLHGIGKRAQQKGRELR